MARARTTFRQSRTVRKAQRRQSLQTLRISTEWNRVRKNNARTRRRCRKGKVHGTWRMHVSGGSGSHSMDPYKLSRFYNTPYNFDHAVGEIYEGKKIDHWSWYFFPTPPWVQDGKERGSSQNRLWCLRDSQDRSNRGYLTGDQAAVAFLQSRGNNDERLLRDRYFIMMKAVAFKLQSVKRDDLVGPEDVPKLFSSVDLFAKASRTIDDHDVLQVCQEVLMHFPDYIFEKYVTKMRKRGECGDQTIIKAAVKCYRRSIWIFKENELEPSIHSDKNTIDTDALRIAHVSGIGERHYQVAVPHDTQGSIESSNPHFQQLLQLYNLRLLDCGGRGDSLFACISYFVKGNPQYHYRVRQELVDYILAYALEFIEGIQIQEIFQYRKIVRKNSD